IKARTPVFFYSKYNGLLACKSPKAGSTLLGALVRALTRKSDNEVFDMFLLGRNEIHNGLNEVFGPMTAKVIKESALTVMVTRDPFSRLYSTFIDKYFLLGRLGREIATHLKRGFKEENEDYCGYDVTFQEFLDYVVYLAENMVEMNEHMVPVAQLCDVCNIKYDLVCRQENLTQGAEEVLRLTNNVTSSRLDAMRKSMTSKYASVFTLVSSHLFDYNNNRQDCPNKMIFMAKMWKTFAIQGLVNSGLDFPEHIFSQFSFVAREAHNITSAILQVTKSKPLSKVNRRLQRLKFLSEAYRDIRWQTIAKLQKVYYLDFLLFGYSKLPPTYYSER
ncbi:uncharacterized protein LOC132558875, partial [Ylistrum balloti]|uniref:uncharacterized protein LOC132558875 n=1 Tax=Ylistrum balloti TaxID=509963 RepID=UPI002905CD3F